MKSDGFDDMHKLKKIDFCRHLSFAVVGGFFAAYAILCRSGRHGNAQTVNLLELLIDALFGRGLNVLLHLGALALYVLGTMLTVLLPHWFHLEHPPHGTGGRRAGGGRARLFSRRRCPSRSHSIRFSSP